jgi:quinol monooxygenase YgiN
MAETIPNVAHQPLVQSAHCRDNGEANNAQPKENAMSVGVLVKLQARPGAEEALAQFIIGALPIVLTEPGTSTWVAYRESTDTFWIVDTNPTEADRDAHLNGRVPAALMARADELLATPPEFHMANVLAIK